MILQRVIYLCHASGYAVTILQKTALAVRDRLSGRAEKPLLVFIRSAPNQQLFR
jgi:hypothetical protein